MASQSNGLHPNHPDAGANPGDEFTLSDTDKWVFGQNQFTCFWRNKPKDGTVTCSRDYPEANDRPYLAAGRPYKTFEEAVKAARNFAANEYERAKAIVTRYEAEDK